MRDEARKAMANQIMTAAKERFGRRITTLDQAQMRNAETAILVQLGLAGRGEGR